MQLMILGASARAAAESAQRCGWQVRACDLFADEDLCGIGETRKCLEYPRQFPLMVHDWAGTPWLYTGGLENAPAVVDRIAMHSPLLGNGGEVLRRVRDPWQLSSALRGECVCFPDIREAGPLAEDGSWLFKPLASAGGTRITVAQTGSIRSTTRPARRAKGYWQRYQPGRPTGAVFVSDQRRTHFLGATRQLSGTRWTGAHGWTYAGSIGPLRLVASRQQQLTRIGTIIADRFALRGLFNVDLIDDGTHWHVLEVNPRYPASLEILERSAQVGLLPLHVEACRNQLPQAKHLETANSPRMCGKAVVYPRRLLKVPAVVRSLKYCADRPRPGTLVQAGRPLLTVFADGTNELSVSSQLQRRIHQLQATLPI